MDFIERIFHVSPDGGNGSLEALYVVVIGVWVVGLGWRRGRTRLRRRR
jgi:hypothetical protein